MHPAVTQSQKGGQHASPGPGTYNVINHTTGERFENIVVSDSNYYSFLNNPVNQDGSPLMSVFNKASNLDAASLTDEPAASNVSAHDNHDSSSDSTVVSSDVFTFGSGECTYDTSPGVTSDGELVEDYGPCADGPDQVVDNTVSVQHGENLPLQAGVACLASGASAATGGLVAAAVGCGLGAAGAIAIDTAVDVTVTTTPANQNIDSEGSSQEGISSSQSAADGDYGTSEEGEFGGTPTEQTVEPVVQQTSNTASNGSNTNSDYDTDNGSGGGEVSSSVSSSQSAADGGYGTSEGGEFG